MNGGPLVPALLLFLIFNAAAQAQRSAFLMGRVIDPSGAVVPDAGVSAVHQDTGFRRSTTTGDGGGYLIASLEPGLYKITVRKEGFIGMVRFDVRVALLEGARADFKLIVGAVQETITVEGEPALLAREDA